MTKKIRVTEDGKQFEAFLKQSLTTTNVRGEKTLIGASFAGSLTSCRAIHAAMYDFSIEIYDDVTNTTEVLKTSRSYRRIEEVQDNVCHTFMVPRMAVSEDYQEQLNLHSKNNNQNMPERVIMTWNQNINEVAGHFLAETFGMPKSKEWIKQYLSLLPSEKIQNVNIETTKVGADLQNLQAMIITSLKEEEMLAFVMKGIQSGSLQTVTELVTEAETTFQDDWSTEDYLRANAGPMFMKIEKYMKPLYDGSLYSPFIAETNRVCVPAQARSVMGLLTILNKKIGAFLSATMGSGKTQMSLTAAYVKARQRETSGAKDGFRSLIVAPANVLPKWATSEIPKALGETFILEASLLSKIDNYQFSKNHNEYSMWVDYKKAKNIATILNTTEDALSYIQTIKSGWRIPKGKIHFILVSTDRMKLHTFGFVLGAKWNPYRTHWTSPDSGKPLQAPNEKKADRKAGLLAKWGDVILKPASPPTLSEIEEARQKGLLDPHGLPIGYVKKWRAEVRSFQDDYNAEKSNCSLARPALKKFNESKYSERWMIAQLFQRMLPKHFHLGIFDEIHQMKAQGSGRGLAFHKILKSCRKSLFLTGTLTNGMSSSIQAVLWRVFPRELLDLGFSHTTTPETWAYRYGVIEKVRKTENGDMEIGITTNRKSDNVIIKEMPGVSPELVANHLLDKTVFMDVSDLQVPMITLEEKPVIVSLDEDHLDEYTHFHSTMYDTCQKLQGELGSAAWSKFNPTVLNYADQPTLGMSVIFQDKEGRILKKLTAPAFPEAYETAKERTVVELVKERLKQERRVIIYTNYTQEYQTNQRLQKVLTQHSIDSVILDGRVSTDKRFDWLEQQTKLGTKVIICNQRLVEVGLDLLSFPTIIFWQMSDDINTVRQSAKRAHRLGQNRHCEVLYLVNDKTQQMAQFQRIMSRRVSALLVEGAIERSDDLAKYAEHTVDGLTKDLSKMLESSDLASAWEQVAQKDMDNNLEMVTEDEFQRKITDAFEKLTKDTKVLCGYIGNSKWDSGDEEDVTNHSGKVDPDVLLDILEQGPGEKGLDQFEETQSNGLEEFIDIFDYLEKTKEESLNCSTTYIQKDIVPKTSSAKKTRSQKGDVYEGNTIFDFAM